MGCDSTEIGAEPEAHMVMACSCARKMLSDQRRGVGRSNTSCSMDLFAHSSSRGGGGRSGCRPDDDLFSKCGFRKSLDRHEGGAPRPRAVVGRAHRRRLLDSRRTLAVPAGAARPHAFWSRLSSDGDRVCRVDDLSGARRRGDSPVHPRQARRPERRHRRSPRSWSNACSIWSRCSRCWRSTCCGSTLGWKHGTPASSAPFEWAG